jgi:hypothetical protein
LKIIDYELFTKILFNVRKFDDIHIVNGSFFEAIKGLSISNLIPFDDAGLKILQNIWTFTYKNKKTAIEHCKNIRCNKYNCYSYYQKTISTYIIRVYNLHNNKLFTIGTTFDDNILYDKIYYIICNIKFMPNFQKFSQLVIEQLSELNEQYTTIKN